MPEKGDPKEPQIPEQLPRIQNPAPQPHKFERFKLEEPLHEVDRDPAGALVSITGHTKSNSGGYLLTRSLVEELGLDPNNFAVEYGVSAVGKRVSLYPVDRQTPNAIAVRQDPDRMEMIFYLKPLFKKHPSLRPEIRTQCDMAKIVDADGAPCIVLALGTGLPKPVRRRSSGEKA